MGRIAGSVVAPIASAIWGTISGGVVFCFFMLNLLLE